MPLWDSGIKTKHIEYTIFIIFVPNGKNSMTTARFKIHTKNNGDIVIYCSLY